MSRTHFDKKCGGIDPTNSTSESSEPAIMMHTRYRQFLLLMGDLETLNNKEEQVKKEGPVKPKLNSKLRRIW
jgi:hypothetical protein